MGSQFRTIVWFRRDLRIEDNPALAAAAKDECVLPVFIWCPADEGKFYPGRVSRWWLKESLIHLGQSLESLGCPLVLIRADSTLAALIQCIGATGATRVVYNHLYDPVSLVRDHQIKNQLLALGISVQSYNADLLHEPWELYDEDGHAFTNFDSFWKKCTSFPVGQVLSLSPWNLVPAKGTEAIDCCSIENLGLENEAEKSSNSLLSRGWSPGWSNADKMLTEFVNHNLLEYSNCRMKVEGSTTSLLSPYLHFGELSVRKVYNTVMLKQMQWADDGNSEARESVSLFLRSIGLREYSRYLCFNFPFTHERSLLGNLKHYPWNADESHFKCWRQGRTGYPLVDAGMRELWATGWLHNRIRVIVASFSVKFLLLPWTWGMKYFWDTLMDADLECDILGWQYISGSLPDGHELNRLDNPEDQGQKFDPDGEYVRSWLPELARMPTKWIHHPWDAPTSVLKAAGVELGINYPKPIIDLNTARERLDDAVSTMWQCDKAAKLRELSGSQEVVADNMIVMNQFDIPKVAVKREMPCSSSSCDQRVPFSDNITEKPRNVDYGSVQRRQQQQQRLAEIHAKAGPLRKEEDVCSTAESSTLRKRSISSSMFAVPTYCQVGVDQSLADVSSNYLMRSATLETDEQEPAEVKEIDAEVCHFSNRPTKRSA